MRTLAELCDESVALSASCLQQVQMAAMLHTHESPVNVLALRVLVDTAEKAYLHLYVAFASCATENKQAILDRVKEVREVWRKLDELLRSLQAMECVVDRLSSGIAALRSES